MIYRIGDWVILPESPNNRFWEHTMEILVGNAVRVVGFTTWKSLIRDSGSRI